MGERLAKCSFSAMLQNFTLKNCLFEQAPLERCCPPKRLSFPGGPWSGCSCLVVVTKPQGSQDGSCGRFSESSLHGLSLQARFSLGMFCVYPGFGSIPVGAQQVISVDCFADSIGKSEEYLTIEISDRDPEDSPNGIPYTLIAESCVPGKGGTDPSLLQE